jgi:hypothetical protein
MNEAREVFICIEGFDLFVRNAMLKHPVPNTTHTHGWRGGDTHEWRRRKRRISALMM